MRIMSLFLCLFFAFSSVHAATPQIDLPSRVEIEKEHDMSSAVMGALFGPAWKIVAGEKAAIMEGKNRYHGIITTILGVINTAAMFILAGGILYMWGIFAVQSAHEGKIYDANTRSMWTPVRHVFSFSLCVPMVQGYSLLQLLILATISFGINMGNILWDTAGKYIVDNTNTAITSSPPPFINSESTSLIEPMFVIAVYDELLKNRNFQLKSPSGRNLQRQGDYIVVADRDNKNISLHLVPRQSRDLDDMGGIVFPGPGVLPSDADTNQVLTHSAKREIVAARLKASMTMWNGIREHARYYLHTKGILASVSQPSKSALDLANDYQNDVMNSIQKVTQNLYAQNSNIKTWLETAIDSKNGESRMGWLSAGLFSHALSQAQNRIDTLIFSGPAGARAMDDYTGVTNDNSWTDMMNGFFQSWEMTVNKISLTDNEKAAFANAQKYVNLELLHGRSYSQAYSSGMAFNRVLTHIFFSDVETDINNRNKGILRHTFDSLQRADPIVVMSQLGSRLLNGSYVFGSLYLMSHAGNAAMSGLGKFIPINPTMWLASLAKYLGGVMGSPFVVALTLALFTIGIVLKFLAPLTPLFIWIYACMYYVLKVAECVIAAPAWAIAHAFPEGAGFAGQHARKGYIMMLDLALRPMLMVTGAVVSIAAWLIIGYLFNNLLSKGFNAFTAFTDNEVDTELVLTVTLLMVMYFFHAKVFSWLVIDMPNNIMNWLGSYSAGPIASHAGQEGERMVGTTQNIAGQLGTLGRAGMIAEFARGKGAPGRQMLDAGKKTQKNDQGMVNKDAVA